MSGEVVTVAKDLAFRSLSERVRSTLSRSHPHTEIGELTVLEGGHSGATYRVDAGSSAFVVKAVPAGQKAVGRNDVLRQARLLSLLATSGVPVPAIAAQDDAEPAWFAMSFAPGEAIEPVLDEHDLPPALAGSRMRRAALELARLHAVPIEHLGLDDVEPLTPLAELERWAKTMNAVAADIVPGGRELAARLGSHVPTAIPPTLVHGDFRLGNFLFEGDRPTALVDWEIWGVGDRRVDLGWFLVFVDASTFPGVGTDVVGLPNADELLELYAPAEKLPDMAWFRALGRMKMAAIMGHNLKRHRQGKHIDPVQETLPPSIAQLIISAGQILDRA